MTWILPAIVLPTGELRTHVCADEDEPRSRHSNEAKLRRDRYWRNPEQERASARKRMAAVYAKRKKAA